VRERYVVGDLVIDCGGRTLEIAGKPVKLAATEFRVLEYLAAKRRDRPLAGPDPRLRVGNIV